MTDTNNKKETFESKFAIHEQAILLSIERELPLRLNNVKLKKQIKELKDEIIDLKRQNEEFRNKCLELANEIKEVIYNIN